MNVLVIEQRPRTRAMLEHLVRDAFDPVAIYCESTLEAAKRKARRIEPLDLVLLDLVMPGCTGADAVTEFREGFASVPVVVVCASDELPSILAAMKAGAVGYIPKNSRRPVMIAALRLVHAGGVYHPPELFAYIKAPDQEPHRRIIEKLTERQREVLRFVLNGHSNPRIAVELQISVGTVKHHVHALLIAFEVATRSKLISIAARGGVRSDGSPITKVV